MKLFKKFFVFIFLIFLSINAIFARDTKMGKVVLLGNKGSGKSSFQDALIYGRKAGDTARVPSEKIDKTLQYTVQHDEKDVTINLTLQDYPGDEDFYNSLPQYYRNAQFAFIFIPLDIHISQKSLDDRLKRWVNDFFEKTNYNENKDNVILTVVGTRLDLAVKSSDQFLFNENTDLIKKKLKQSSRSIDFIVISNNDPDDVKSKFESVIKENFDRVNPILEKNGQYSEGIIKLNRPVRVESEEEKNGCCVVS